MLTLSALASEVQPYRGRVIRIVEAQHRISTNRLAKSAADQAVLEALADEVKPQLPEAARHLPWLLASPFRYGLGRPSRFRAPDTLPGIFYSSEDIETAVTETAYWRLAAFARSPGFQQPHTPTPMSAFSVTVDAASALNLMDGNLAKDHDRWAHPSDYTATQRLAAAARPMGVAAIRAPSARCRDGINVAVLQPSALVPPPKPHSSWALIATATGLIATKEMSSTALRFESRDFGLS
jgi:hypothetical protein